MKNSLFNARLGGALLLACLAVFGASAPSFAQDLAPEVSRDRVRPQVEQRADALLSLAVQHIKVNGQDGAREFSRQPVFVDRDLYVYALRTDGLFLGSGGWSASLIGQNVLKETDSQGRYFFQEMIDLAKENGRGEIQYHWFNPADSRDEPKVTEFVAVGDVVIAVGYFPPRATRIQAKGMLQRALSALDNDSEAALKTFQQADGPFIKNDLYVFVVDTRDQRFLAHGASPALVGTNAYDLLDAAGGNVVYKMAQIAKEKGSGELDYFWLNPITGRIESKHTYFRLDKGLLVAVGSYSQ